MSEYIITDEQLNRFFHCPTAECDEIKANLLEVIRCRDCAHFRKVRMSDGTETERCSGAMAYIQPDPNGFCAWGKQEEA